MPPKPHSKLPPSADVIDLGSSDDDDVVPTPQYCTNIPNTAIVTSTIIKSEFPLPIPNVTGSNHTLENRSFWRAGAYEIGNNESSLLQGDLEHARVHPKFLHSNATCHRWAFGAIAELLDNAVDEIDNGATFVKVDRIFNAKDNSPALLFHDDGAGMDPEGMRKCMSLGYFSKTSNTTIGLYGNGFKTSTMRLGADVIVFSRAARSGRATQTVGLLSYTFLMKTHQDDVIVPMIDFDISDNWAEPLVYGSKDDWSNNLKTILEWSPFASKEDLLSQFVDIGSHGTKVLIYNLWMNDEGIYELNFDDDDEDITLRDETNQGISNRNMKKVLELQSHLSYRMRYSLRAYASILYLRNFTNFKIILRGKPVEQFSIADDLKYSKSVSYKPYTGASSREVIVDTTIGFIKEAPALVVCGFNIYHKNRLIRPYWKVTIDGNSKGHGVVGVLRANFIEPAHDKQDFERSALFLKLESKLKQMVMEYWRGHCHLIGHLPTGVRKNDFQKKVTTKSQGVVGGVQNEPNLQSPGSVSATVQLALGPGADSVPEASLDTRSIDDICEENIQLFLRCGEYVEKEVELRRKVEELEKELEGIKQKCARVSANMETQRKELSARR